MQKGDIAESEFSKILHGTNTPFLISSQLLRSMNLGQVDVAYLKRNTVKKSWVLCLVEVKTSFYPTKFQMRRLLKTQEYLSRILEIESKLEVKFCQKDNDSLCF